MHILFLKLGLEASELSRGRLVGGQSVGSSPPRSSMGSRRKETCSHQPGWNQGRDCAQGRWWGGREGQRGRRACWLDASEGCIRWRGTLQTPGSLKDSLSTFCHKHLDECPRGLARQERVLLSAVLITSPLLALHRLLPPAGPPEGSASTWQGPWELTGGRQLGLSASQTGPLLSNRLLFLSWDVST